jgi:tape measure domain-containing protein
MGIRDVTVGVGADLSDLQREAARAPSIVSRMTSAFNKALPRSIPTPTINTGNLRVQGAMAGRAFVDGMNSQLRNIGRNDPFAPMASRMDVFSQRLAGALAVGQIARWSDEWTSAGNRLALVTDSVREQERVQRQLFDTAQETRAEFGATVSLYTKVERNANQLGVTQAEVARITETVNKAFAVSGATAKESSQGIHQLGQALASGVLRGDEFNTISEAAPRLRDAIAEAAGVSIGELRKMAEAGELTAGLVSRAMLTASDAIDSEFDRMQITIGQSVQQLENSAIRWIGQTGEMTGASALTANSISFLANNFDTAATALMGFIAIRGARALGAMGNEAISASAKVVGGLRSERRATLERAEAEVAIQRATAQTAAQHTASVQTQIANLNRLELEIQQNIATERRRLGELATLQSIQNRTPVTSLAPLGGQAMAREMAIREQTQRELERSTRSLAQADAALLNIQRQRVVVEGQLAGAIVAETGAVRAATAAETTRGAAIAATSTRALAGAAAARGLGIAVGALGGPIGIAILALTGLVFWFQKQKAEAENAANAIEDYKTKVQSLPAIKFQEEERSVEKQLNEASRKYQELRRQLQVPLPEMGGQEVQRINRENAVIQQQMDQTRTKLTQLVGQFGALREVQQDNMDRQAANVVAADAAVEAEANRLGKLRNLGIATQNELRRINEIVAADRARMKQLLETPEPQQNDRLRQERYELQQRINMLTQETQDAKGLRARLKLDTREAREEITNFTREADATIVRYKLAVETGAPIELQNELLAAVVAKEEEVNRIIAARGGLRGAEIQYLQQQQQLLDVLRLPPIEFKGPAAIVPIEPVLVPGSLRYVVDQIKKTEAQIEVAQIFGNRQEEEAASERRISHVIRMIALLENGGLSAQQIKDQLNEAGVKAEDVAAAMGKITGAVSFEGIAAGLRGAIRIADAFGEIPGHIQNAVEGIADMATSAAEIRRAMDMPGGMFGSAGGVMASISGIMGVIGGLGSIYSAFTAEPAWVAEHNSIQESNNSKLDELAASLDGFQNTLGNMNRIEGQIARLLTQETQDMFGDTDSFIEDLKQRFGWPYDDNAPRKFLENELNKLGLSIQEINRVAEANDIQIFDKEGNPVPEALIQLRDALRMTREALMQWGSTIQAQTDKISAYNDIFEVDDTPVQNFNDQLKLLNQFAPDIGKMFDNIDVSTVAGQQAAEQIIRDLFLGASAETENAIRQAIMTSDFESLDEFIKTIRGMDNALDKFQESVNKATYSVTNLPEGFRLNMIRFQSIIPQVAPDFTVTTQPGWEEPLGREIREVADSVSERRRILETALDGLSQAVSERATDLANGTGRQRTAVSTAAATLPAAPPLRETIIHEGDTFPIAPGAIIIQAGNRSIDELWVEMTRKLRQVADQRGATDITAGLDPD